jgi:hypothetical protein
MCLGFFRVNMPLQFASHTVYVNDDPRQPEPKPLSSFTRLHYLCAILNPAHRFSK